MHRIALASLIGLATFGAVSANGTAPLHVESLQIEGRSLDEAAKGQSVDARAEQAIEDAAAAAVIGALQTRFAGQAVEFRMGGMRSERASLRDIALHGTGLIRLGRDAGWLPVRFDALYDTDAQIVQSPAIVLGDSGMAASAQQLPLPGLQRRLELAMSAEFASQQVDFTLADARVVADDGRRLVVRGDGLARFDGHDAAKATVHAIYDRGSGRWIDPQYDFDVVGG